MNFKLFFILSIPLFFVLSVSAQTKKNTKPNIIYIYADDMGYGELGCYGQTKIKTPNLDKIATEGIRFTQHYTAFPVCAPARCALMTGKHSGHSYIRGNNELGGFADSAERGQQPLAATEFTVARLVKQQGYKTALIGKWGMGMNKTEGEPTNHGFDYYYGYLDQKQAHNFFPTHLWENGKWDTLNPNYINVHKQLNPAKATDADFAYYKGEDKHYAPAKMTEKALVFIEKSKNEPFFLYLPYTIPHISLQAPDEYVKKYIGLFNEQPYYGNKGYASTKYPLSTYAAMITYLDDQIGIIMAKIKQLGLDENTIVMFSSDNGATFNGGVDVKFFNSVTGLRGLKMDLYEGGIRVPFIARWPGKIKAGTTSSLISAQYDVFATIAELTQQKVTNTDGISFVKELSGKTKQQKKHEYLYFEYSEKGGQVAIRMGDWKGVKSGMKKNKNASWELYNLAIDRNETTNVATQHPELIRKFETIISKEHQPSNANVPEWNFVGRYKK